MGGMEFRLPVESWPQTPGLNWLLPVEWRVERDDWPETPHFAAWLARHARAAMLTRERLLVGDFIDDLQRLWAAPEPAVPLADGADAAASCLLQTLRL